MNEDLLGMDVHCIVCTKPIATEAARRRAVVCSEECREMLARLRRKHKDDRICRFCHKPSTVTQRTAFNRFQRWERTHPQEAFPETWRLLREHGISAETFAAAVQEAKDQDFSMEFSPVVLRWARFPKPNKKHENLDLCMPILTEFWAAQESQAQESATEEEQDAA